MSKQESFPIRVKWVDKFQFIASDQRNHAIIIDTSKDSGGEDAGIGPMSLLLCALGACTGMDIVDILRKERQKLSEFHVELRAERNEELPYYYKKIEMRYVVRGKNLKEKSVQRAINLSKEKYCSVEQTLAHNPAILSTYEIQED